MEDNNNTTTPQNKFGLFGLIKNAAMQNIKKSQNKQDFSSFAQHHEKTELKGGLIKKIFANKQIKIAIVVLIFSFCALLILNSSFGEATSKATQNKEEGGYTTSLTYCKQLENKLENVLSKISGAGSVSVMITVGGAPELIVASSSSEKTNSGFGGDGVIVSSDPVIVTNGGVSSPLILTEKLPEITGVVVVAQGAKETKIKLMLLQAVQALLNVKSSNIQIYY